MQSSSRMRINRDQAGFLKDLLSETRHRLVVRRADAKDRGEDLAEYQTKISTVTRLQAELDRALADMEWRP